MTSSTHNTNYMNYIGVRNIKTGECRFCKKVNKGRDSLHLFYKHLKRDCSYNGKFNHKEWVKYSTEFYANYYNEK